MKKHNLTGMTLEEMEIFIKSIGQPRYRANQLFRWIYKKQITDFSEMTNFTKDLRQQLSENINIGIVQLVTLNNSPNKETQKFLFQLEDGNCIESVFMKVGKRKTICLSSQVGCALKCSFCATGKMGHKRNLSTGEIIDQLLFIKKYLNTEITNIVLMGMGEPFLNYDNVITACNIISHDKGITLSKQKIIISTSGIIPAIRRFTDEKHKYKLAISLNAASNETRNKIMPINEKYSLGELINSAKYYYNNSKQQVTFEYVLIEGINDGEEDAYKLKKLLKGFPCKINIIPYNNQFDDKYACQSEKNINEFIKPLLNEKIVISVRRSKGDDIDAACGQLYHKAVFPE